MPVARLQAVTRETIEIQFRLDTEATPGGAGTGHALARGVSVSLAVPPDRPLPDRVLVRFSAQVSRAGSRVALYVRTAWGPVFSWQAWRRSSHCRRRTWSI